MMRALLSRRLFVKLLVSYLSIVFLALTVLGVLFVYMMHKYFFRVEGWELSARADKVISLMKKPLSADDQAEIRSIARTLAYSYEVKLWVIDKDGATLASSEAVQPESGLKLEESEMKNVLAGNVLTKQITGPEFNSLLCVKPVIVPEKNGNSLLNPAKPKKEEVWGVLAVEAPLGKTSATLGNIAKLGVYAALPAVLLAVFAGLTFSRRISRPIEEMNAVARDISKGNLQKRVRYKSGDEMEQLAQMFNQAVEQVVSTVEQQKRLERLRKEFLSNIAHEFKAPLTSLRGFLELMLDGKLRPEQQARYLQIMLLDTIHLDRLVQDLLDLSSLESGEVSLNLAAIPPGELVQWAAEHFQPLAQQNRIMLSTGRQPDLPLVRADRDRVHQVLLNLVKNAFQHTPPGGEIKLAASRARENPEMVFFTVSDTGSGIPEEELENIWDRFYKVDRARTRKEAGTGLGLAIVKEIVKRHGGRVFVESAAGKGSVFGFTLPAASREANDARLAFNLRDGENL